MSTHSIETRLDYRVRLKYNRRGWWYGSTAIPLQAAFVGPIANILSIAALVTYWRNNYSPAAPGNDEDSVGFPDPPWLVHMLADELHAEIMQVHCT